MNIQDFTTELGRLNKIYNYCYPKYKDNLSSICVYVDMNEIAGLLDMTKDEFFNYLYYDLNVRCNRMFQMNVSSKTLAIVGDKQNDTQYFIHMGYLEAMRKDEIKTWTKFVIPTTIAIISLVISILSFYN